MTKQKRLAILGQESQTLRLVDMSAIWMKTTLLVRQPLPLMLEFVRMLHIEQ